MTLKSYLQQAILYFTTAKLRAFLAMLGILVGTASIVALIDCSQLATAAALAQFKAMGTELLGINLYQQQNPQGQSARQKSEIPLSTWQQFPSLLHAVRDIAPFSTVYQATSYEGHAITAPMIAANESLARILHIRMAKGHFVSSFESYEHHCVIGHRLAEQFQRFNVQDPLGAQIQVGTVLYTIIGITKPWKENSFFNEDINNAIIIPLKGATLMNANAQINNAILLLRPHTNIEDLTMSLKHLIRKQAPKLGVFVRSPQQIIESMEKQSRIFTLLLGTIGGIALLVGGIGIMNVMLVALSERKQEIGIRKALGATQRHIQYLFLTEAIFLSVTGGLLGVLLGLLLSFIIAQLNHWPFIFYTFPLFIGFTVSTLTGVFFGFYPAYRAAKLDPVVSLRL